MINDRRDRDPLEELAAEFVEQHRRGMRPTVDAYARRYPDLAEEIRDLFPTIAELENLKSAGTSSSDGSAVAGLPFTSLGDYRLIREIGRGGMGVVYEAEQVSLQRRVALKVLGANIANCRKQMARFQREAEASANLHHTHIVPVLGIGQEHGIHFYVMQLVDGAPLSEVIQQMRPASENVLADSPTRADDRGTVPLVETRPSPATEPARADRSVSNKPAIAGSMPSKHGFVRRPGKTTELLTATVLRYRQLHNVAAVVADLADALQYAHDHGVLHRDIKPANILVDKQGASWITDFGLARHEDWDAITQTGDLLGTLRYMAPEQFSGHCDRRSDVYSLGLTLFELLTLTPAFTESQQAAMIQQKLSRGVKTPREQNPRVGRDLETITLKACAREPRDRYQSAQEFADDLRRFLSDRPIKARRTPVVERFWRWAKRNPMVAGLSSLAAGLLLAVAVVAGIGAYSTEQALEQARAQQSEAQRSAIQATQANQRAEANLQLALTSLNEISQQVSQRGVPQSLIIDFDSGEAMWDTAVVNEADAALLTSLLEFSQRFAAENQLDLTAETAEARRRIGDIQQRLGQLPQAMDAYRQSLADYQSLAEQGSQSVEWVVETAKTWNRLAVVLSQQGQIREAVEAHLAAIELLEKSQGGIDSEARKFQLAQSLSLLGSVWSRANELELIELWQNPPGRGRGMDRRGMFAGPPPRGLNAFPRGPGRGGRGRGPGARPEGGRPPLGPPERRLPWVPGEEGDPLVRATELLQQLLDEDPDKAVYQLTLARTLRSQLQPRRGPGRSGHSDAQEIAAQVTDLLQRLVEQEPGVALYQFELADTLCFLARRHYLQGAAEGTAESIRQVEQAITLCESLLRNHPNNSEYLALLGSAEGFLGGVAARSRDFPQAERRLDRALQLQKQLAEQHPQVALYQLAYARTLADWSELLLSQNDLNSAYVALQSAITVSQQAWSIPANHVQVGHFVEGLYRQMTRLETRMATDKRRADAGERSPQGIEPGTTPRPRSEDRPREQYRPN